MIKKIKEFETNQCIVTVYDTGIVLFNEQLFVVQSLHKNNGNLNTRFANEKQLKNLISTYHIEKEFSLWVK